MPATPRLALLAGFADVVAFPAVVAVLEQVDARATAARAMSCVREDVAAIVTAASTILAVGQQRVWVPAEETADLARLARVADDPTTLHTCFRVDARAATAACSGGTWVATCAAMGVTHGQISARAVAARVRRYAETAKARAATIAELAVISVRAWAIAAAAMAVISLGIDAQPPARSPFGAGALAGNAGQIAAARSVAASAVLLVVTGIDAERTAQDLIAWAPGLALPLDTGAVVPAAVTAAATVQRVGPRVDARLSTFDRTGLALLGFFLALLGRGLRGRPAQKRPQDQPGQRPRRAAPRPA